MEKLTGHSKVIHELAKKKAQDYLHAEGELLAALIEVDVDQTYRKFKETHLTPYCVKHLKLDPNLAAVFVRIVRKSHHVPELASAVQRGDLCLYKAKTIASVITPENKEEWLQKAKKIPKAKLEREVASASGVETKTVKLEMTFDDIELLKRNQVLYANKLRKIVSYEETLRWVMENNLNRFDPIRKARRSWDRSELQRVDHEDQGKCRYVMPDGSECEEEKWVEHHHIQPRSRGGPDTRENLITLCAAHHRMVHQEH